MGSNRQNILGEIVSVESWYKSFSADTLSSDLYLHVRFQEAVFGGDPSHVVRFKLRLKKADVVVICEDPISIPRSNVRRDRLDVEAKIVEKTEETKGISGGVSAGAKITKAGPSGEVGAKGQASASRNSSRIETREIRHSGTLVEHSMNPEGNNRWSFNPAQGPHLFGHAFQSKKRVMEMKHPEKILTIPPVVKVQVRCLREDIEILDLEPKEKGIKDRLALGIGEEKKRKLAEEIIKKALSTNGLEFEDVSEPNALLTIADVIAAEE